MNCVRGIIDKIPDNNFMRGDLMNAANEEYNPKLFFELMTGETFASKLSWKYGNLKLQTEKGKKTNYGYLLNLEGIF